MTTTSTWDKLEAAGITEVDCFASVYRVYQDGNMLVALSEDDGGENPADGGWIATLYGYGEEIAATVTGTEDEVITQAAEWAGVTR